ncbi:MAG: MATE family efflux transporter, partial [Polyangiaceae bacterium]
MTLAWPIAAAMAGETMIGLVDTKLVGGISAVALGGVGMATTLMYLQYAIIFGLMRGVKVRTSFAVGEGRVEDGLTYARAGVIMGGLAGVVIFLLARDVGWALDLLRVDASIKAPAQEFLGAVTFGAPATCALAALIQHRQAIGDSRTPMVVGIAGNVLNAALAIALIYGKLGLPAMGVRGAGYATAFTENVELVVMGLLLVRAKGARTLPWRRAFREVAELGVPTGLQFGFEMLAFTAFTAILGSISSQEIASHQIALATIRTSF